MAPSQIPQHNPFSFPPFPSAPPPAFPALSHGASYNEQRALPRLIQDGNGSELRPEPYPRHSPQQHHQQHPRAYGDDFRHSPPVKHEQHPGWPQSTPAQPPAQQQQQQHHHHNQTTPAPTPPPHIFSRTLNPTTPLNGTAEVTFRTEIDNLVRTIQSKGASATPPASPDKSRPGVGSFSFAAPLPFPGSATQRTTMPVNATRNVKSGPRGDGRRANKSSRRYLCKMDGCFKSFNQKTHLDIHERAHTGLKPFPCKEPTCGQSFSQLGNLKTHERRHTGERPYVCDLCGKSFAQRGNVRAHKIVHNQAKPYLCRLDDCGKQFTQLGNLKSHQNKFHIITIRNLTSKFASIKDSDAVHPADRDLWEYFANLYKNSNKGIKGRGKDRKVGTGRPRVSSTASALSSTYPALAAPGRTAYPLVGMSPSAHSHAQPQMSNQHQQHPHQGGVPMHGHNSQGPRYDMFDVDDDSQTGSHPGSVGHSSVGHGGSGNISISHTGRGGASVYDSPTPGDVHVYDDGSRGVGGGAGDMAFGDRNIY